jgi:hypothetical protein
MPHLADIASISRSYRGASGGTGLRVSAPLINTLPNGSSSHLLAGPLPDAPPALKQARLEAAGRPTAATPTGATGVDMGGGS